MDNSNLNTLLDTTRLNTPRQKVYITNDIDHFISKTKELSIGDIVIHTRFGVINDTYMYDGITLAKLDNDSNNSVHKEKEKIKMIPKTCKCCGAPMNNNSNTCEYCGVNYE